MKMKERRLIGICHNVKTEEDQTSCSATFMLKKVIYRGFVMYENEKECLIWKFHVEVGHREMKKNRARNG